MEAGVAGGGAAPPDCSSPRRISGPAGPLLSSPLSSLPFSLNWRGRGLRRGRAGYTPAISPARAAPYPLPVRAHGFFPARKVAAPVFPARIAFPLRVASAGRLGDAFLREATP